LRNGKLCSGSADTSIIIWNIKKDDSIQTFSNEDNNWVKCVFELDNGIIVAGCGNKIIKLWKPKSDNTYEISKIIGAHSKEIRTLCQVDETHFASGSFDNTIKIWDIDTLECVQTLDEQTSYILGIINLKMEGKQALASCSKDKTIKIWKKTRPK
jgi:WD40 repeat protein